MRKICYSWIGDHDLNYITNKSKGAEGPIIALLNSKYCKDFNELSLLYDLHRKSDVEKYIEFLKSNFKFKMHFNLCNLKDPTDYNEIYMSVRNVIDKTILDSDKSEFKFHFHTSPGTSQMSSIWLLLAKTIYPAVLYQSHYNPESKTQHVKIADVPFNIDIEFLPDLKKKADVILLENWIKVPEYNKIIHQSDLMAAINKKALKIAAHDVPVLILGETGTGKELFAKMIHENSSRVKLPMQTVNCASIQETTANAMLFGWSKGAWTGSVGEGKGKFVECNNGILFLDEIGDLSVETQTKLLRALQEGEIQRVGDGKVFKIDVRVIAATNKDLPKMIAEGKFREDLFHRINVGIINLPPLRERGNDIGLIAGKFLDEINKKFDRNLIYKYKHKKFSINAKKFMLNYSWPGNVRELYHTIERACMWSENDTIDENIMQDAIFKMGSKSQSKSDLDQLSRKTPVNLEHEITEIKKNYIQKALEISNGNKTEASRLLGYKNYQTLAYDIEKLGITID